MGPKRLAMPKHKEIMGKQNSTRLNSKKMNAIVNKKATRRGGYQQSEPTCQRASEKLLAKSPLQQKRALRLAPAAMSNPNGSRA